MKKASHKMRKIFDKGHITKVCEESIRKGRINWFNWVKTWTDTLVSTWQKGQHH